MLSIRFSLPGMTANCGRVGSAMARAANPWFDVFQTRLVDGDPGPDAVASYTIGVLLPMRAPIMLEPASREAGAAV